MTTTANIEPLQTSTGPTHLRIIADYQLMSDSDAATWADEMLKDAVNAGKIVSYVVTGAHQGVLGLALITFTVDVPFTDDGPFNLHMTQREAKHAAADLLNEILHDSDVDLRWISPQYAA